MNSTKLHSLLRDAGRRNGSRRLGLQRWRARRRIKEKGKPGGDFSKTGAADRECNVEHMQAAADSNGREKKTGEAPGAWQQRERGLRMATGLKEKGMGWADGFRRAGWREQD